MWDEKWLILNIKIFLLENILDECTLKYNLSKNKCKIENQILQWKFSYIDGTAY